MKLLVTGITALLTVSLLSPARATCPPGGGNNETSELFTLAGGNWAVSAMSPGTVAGGLSSPDLLITEISFTNNNQEFVEIYNPTANTINLDQYYLSDEAATGVGYWRVVLGAGYSFASSNTDFNVKFPNGATIAPGATKVIFMGAAGANVLPAAPIVADYEVVSANAGIPDMVPLGTVLTSTNGALTNGGEYVMLYKWDGVCDLVCDVDYVAWGTTVSASSRIDKTGISIDGIDGDAATSSYLADTPIATQGAGQSHTAGNSIQRVAVGVHAANGNGCMILIVPVEETTWGGIKSLYR